MKELALIIAMMICCVILGFIWGVEASYAVHKKEIKYYKKHFKEGE